MEEIAMTVNDIQIGYCLLKFLTLNRYFTQKERS